MRGGRGRSRDEKVCAWSAWETKISRNGAERALNRPTQTSHQPTLAFFSKLNAEHRAAPKKFLPAQSRPLLPSRNRCPASDGTSRALRVNRACPARLFPSSLPCSWLGDPLHVCIGTCIEYAVENSGGQQSRTIVRRARGKAWNASVLARLPSCCILSLEPLNHLSRHHFCSPRAPSKCSV